MPIEARFCLKRSRSSVRRIDSTGVPRTLTLYFFKIPFSSSSRPRLSAVCPPKLSRMTWGLSFAMIFSTVCDVQRLQIDLIGHIGIGLDGGDIGIDQDGAAALFFQSFDRLRARIIEFARLADPQVLPNLKSKRFSLFDHARKIFQRDKRHRWVLDGFPDGIAQRKRGVFCADPFDRWSFRLPKVIFQSPGKLFSSIA